MTHSRSRGWILPAATLAGLFAFAFVAAARPCEQALDTWALAGGATLVALIALALAVPAARPFDSRPGSALILGAVTAAVWLAGLFAAEIPVLCRLF